MNVHYSSKTNEWSTPNDLFLKLNNEFEFTLDPCCTKENSKCNKYFTIEDNGLIKSWSGERVFMNPPYGRQIVLWIAKAFNESRNNTHVVCLIPARTDTIYWHRYCMLADEIRLIKGRVKFGNQLQSAPFPSAIVIFNSHNINDIVFPIFSTYCY